MMDKVGMAQRITQIPERCRKNGLLSIVPQTSVIVIWSPYILIQITHKHTCCLVLLFFAQHAWRQRQVVPFPIHSQHLEINTML